MYIRGEMSEPVLTVKQCPPLGVRHQTGREDIGFVPSVQPMPVAAAEDTAQAMHCFSGLRPKHSVLQVCTVPQCSVCIPLCLQQKIPHEISASPGTAPLWM